MGESRSKKICKDLTEMIGDTPMVYLNNVTKDIPAKIACKVEYFGPTCSVKDRTAWAMIHDAEKKGLIHPGKSVIIEPTSGNTGIALAALCAARGYKMIMVMPDGDSVERRAVARALGAQVVLTDTKLGMREVMERCNKLLEWIPNSFMPMQFENMANPQTHYENTGREIWQQTQGTVDICVFGGGTGETITGVGRYLKERKPEVKMYVVEPEESAALSGITGVHCIQGLGLDTYDATIVEEVVRVSTYDACEMAKRLAREEGLLAGISSGANVFAALEIAKRPENAGKLIVTCLPSFGERYLSTCLYKGVRNGCEKMDVSSFDQDKEYLKTALGL